jgi:hypothetical protein
MKVTTGLLASLTTQVTGAMNVKAMFSRGKPRELRNDFQA